jgi:hypothetical protein
MYLLLAQNTIQDIFEFEICHHWVSLSTRGMIRGKRNRLVEFWADARIFGLKLWGANKAESLYWAAVECSEYPFLTGEIGIDEMRLLAKLVAEHEEWLLRNQPGYGGAQPSLPTIVITETPLHGQYISNTVGRIAARVALDADLGSHYSTRACLWDFTANVSDVKSGILIGYVCTDCREALLKCLSAEEVKEFERLMRRTWLGKLDDTGSVASNLKRVFDYDLSTTRGLELGLIDRFQDIVWSTESVKFILAIVGGLVVWFLAKHNIKIELVK